MNSNCSKSRRTICRFIGILSLLLGCYVPRIPAQTPTDLSGLAFILDPGHSQNENIGMYGYSEAYKVLDVAFHLKEFLDESGADTVALTRTDRVTSVSITQRYTFANNFPHPNKWFHSIHSDAASMGSSANSILILISDRCATTSGKICDSRWGTTTISMGNWQSDLMSRAYRIPTRGVYGDRTFGLQFGTSYGSAGVGVLRETTMPATLSEGGFHTNPRQNLLNMNMESKRTEAKAIWLAMLGHFGVVRPPVRTLIGIISDVETNAPLRGARATADGRTYVTNTYDDTFRPYCGSDTTCSNGFYYFENLPAGALDVSFGAPGYLDTTVNVAIVDSFFTLLDVKLISTLPPRVVSSFPAQGQTGILPNATLRLDFSRKIDRPSAESNIYLLGPGDVRVPGQFSWLSDFSLTLRPDSILLMDTTYQLIVGSQVRDLYGHLLDGNGDGIAGDSLVITFRTRSADVRPPAILTALPHAGAVLTSSNHVINITFDEPLNPSTVTISNVSLQQTAGPGSPKVLPRTLAYSEAAGRGAINVYPDSGLFPGRSYRLRVSGVADQNGNAVPSSSPFVWDFSVASAQHQYTTIDDLNNPLSSWWEPGASGSTVGLDSAFLSRDSIVVLPILASNSGSAELKYYWRTTASDWLIRVYLSSGAPRSVTWRKEDTKLQVYIHGDGSGTLFRFAVDDSVEVFPAGRTENHEVSEWIPIDWVGWRLVEWDLENDPVGSWLGNGKLEGTLRFDSFQLKYVPGTSASSGRIYFDQLQLAKKLVTFVAAENEFIPVAFTLYQNYPNPFNPETRITYDVGQRGFVTVEVLNLLGRRVRTLVSGEHLPGRYTIAWDARDDNQYSVASGLYFYRLQAKGVNLIKKMLYLK